MEIDVRESIAGLPDAERRIRHLQMVFQTAEGRTFAETIARQIDLLREPLEERVEAMTATQCRDDLLKIATLKAVLRIPEQAGTHTEPGNEGGTDT